MANTEIRSRGPMLPVHGASVLPNVIVDAYNCELEDEDGFVADIARAVRERGYDVVFCAYEGGLLTLSRRREEIAPAVWPYASYEVVRRTSGYRIRIALENTAGGGHTLGRTFGELGELITRAARPERLGVCIDTCHLFAAGYDIRSAAGWEVAVQECAKAVDLRRVLAFHLNDARAPFASGLDRHEHIGDGFLGLGAFRHVLKDARFARVPKVLETPKDPEPEADRRNLKRLRGLRRTKRSRSGAE